jgi:hypothetical protein
MNKRGQAAAELAMIVPLLVMLCAGAMAVAYICWQGIKTQEAANLAARIQGQERVSGGTSVGNISFENGDYLKGDSVPGDPEDVRRGLRSRTRPPLRTVYGRYYAAAKSLFSPNEQTKLFIPRPVTRTNSDEVRVVRVMNPPKVFNFELPSVKIESNAYGGEDSYMYGLPRWGKVGNGDKPFYQTQIKEK